MKHPIYDHPDIVRLTVKIGRHMTYDDKEDIIQYMVKLLANDRELLSSLNSMYNNFYKEEDYTKFLRNALVGIALICITFLSIVMHGHVCVDGTKYNWDSETSRRTINLLSPSTIKFPFQSGVIKFEKYDVFFSWFPERPSGIGGLSLHRFKKDGFDTLELRWNDLIGEQTKNYEKSNLEFFYQTISVLLYISTFRDNNKRVYAKKIKAKVNKKTNSPNHKVHLITLKQIEKNDEITHREGTTWSSDKTWIVRGHWRHYENKIVWIDQYWKGIGKEIFQEKIYKV